MSAPAVKAFRDLQKNRSAVADECFPAFDEFLAYSLERKYLKIPKFKDVLVATSQTSTDDEALNQFLKNNVRLAKIDEISFDAAEDCHLPGVESVITSMRDRGYSLVFVVQGERFQTSVYLGISKFAGDESDINPVIDGYEATWKANFPGSQLKQQSDKEIKGISYKISQCKSIGVLTGIPSLKREEESNQFVQGLERLIRAMRGKTYFWMTIADPLPEDVIGDSIDVCQQLQSDIHHLVKTDLSNSTSNGKTIMLGGFGMVGNGTSDSTAHTDSSSTTRTSSDSFNQNHLEGYQRASAVATPVLGVAGAIIGSFICPGIGTAIGGALGPAVGGLINGIGGAITGKNGFSKGHTDSLSNMIGSADTIQKAVSRQTALGGFGSFGITLTKTTTVGEELLNRKVQYAEECLKNYEKRLHEGMALGMWNLGHYFCAEDDDTFNLGTGVVSSLFTGMDSSFEPPRTIKMPESFSWVLRRFNNVYLQFNNEPIVDDHVSSPEKLQLRNHPLGVIFNGPATPVTTRELAVAMPVATRDVEGVTVTERASFGVDVSAFRYGQKAITVGTILDKGNATCLDYHLVLENLPKHLAVFGLTGSGKTNTVHHLLTQLWKNNNDVPFMVIEPAKAEYRALAKTDELKDRLLVFTAGVDKTSVSPLRLNPFDFNPGKDDDAHRVHILTHIDRLKSVFNASFPMYASMPYILEEAILEVYKERGWDLAASRNVYVDDIYTQDFSDYIPTLEDLYYKIDSVVTRKGYFKEQQMNIQAALKSRLSSLMVGAKGSLFNCKKSISDEDLFEQPVVVELENMGDDDEKAFLMGMLVTRLYEYRKATFSNVTGADKSLKHVLVIEEAHRLLANVPDTSSNAETANVKGKSVSTFVDMLSEIRAFGQSVFVVDQLPSRVSPNIVKGTGAKIVHRLLARDDRESVGETMGLNDEQIKDLCLLRTGECVVNQDGDRKSYMCAVRENAVHAKREGGEISVATKKFVEQHKDLLGSELSSMDLDNDFLRSSLYRLMLAAGVSSGIVNTHCLEGFKEKDEGTDLFKNRMCAYWIQISRYVWGHYQGDYSKFLRLVEQGNGFLMGKSAELSTYRMAFADYFLSSRKAKKYLTDKLPLIAYDHLFEVTKALGRINKQYDLVCDAKGMERLGKAIRIMLPELLPADSGLAARVVSIVVEAIVARVNANLDPAVVISTVKEGGV